MSAAPAPGPTQSVSELVYRDGTPAHDDPCEVFVEESKLYPSTLQRQALPREVIEFVPYYRDATPRSTKSYAACATIELPPAQLPTATLDVVMRSRRTRYAAKNGPFGLAELSALLFAGYGITGAIKDSQVKQRTSPSGGALYPLDLFWINECVTDLPKGVYHFNPFRHNLEVVAQADFGAQIREALIQTEMSRDKVGYLAISASFWRSRFKYGLRGCRFAMIETGHVAQNILLAAEGLKIMAACLGGYYDFRVDRILRLDGVNETTVYVMAFSKHHD